MSRWSLYQCIQVEVISSRSARVVTGPLRKGELSGMHSDLYKAIVVSASALSKAGPVTSAGGGAAIAANVGLAMGFPGDATRGIPLRRRTSPRWRDRWTESAGFL